MSVQKVLFGSCAGNMLTKVPAWLSRLGRSVLFRPVSLVHCFALSTSDALDTFNCARNKITEIENLDDQFVGIMSQVRCRDGSGHGRL